MLKTGLSEKDSQESCTTEVERKGAFFSIFLTCCNTRVFFLQSPVSFLCIFQLEKKIKQRQSTVFHGTLVTPLQIAGFTDFYSWCQPWCEPAGTGWLAELASSSRGAETWNVEKKPGVPMHGCVVADFLHKLHSCFYSQGLPLFFSSLLFCIPEWLLSLYSCAWIPTGKCT